MRPHESLHRQDMKDVGYEEPAEVLFDPKRDITQADRESFKEFLLWCKTQNTSVRWRGFSETARALKAFDPTFHLQALVTDADRSAIQKSFGETMQSNNKNSILLRAEIIVAIHEIEPSSSPDAIFPGIHYQSMRDALHQWREDPVAPMNYFYIARVSNALRIGDAAFNIHKELTDQDLAAMREALPTFIKINRWDLFAEYAIMLHDLGRDSGLWPPISLPDRASALAVLEKYRQRHTMLDRIILCYALSLLSKSQGNPTSTESPVQPLPTVKTY